MNTDSIVNYIETKLSEKRRIHTYAVRDTALKLCDIYGCNREKAEIASLCHDFYRGIYGDELDAYVRRLGLPDRYLGNANLAHGKIAAAEIRDSFGINDDDIINAVSYHTTGRSGMSLLEKIVFIADAIEPNRDYPHVDELRELALSDIDAACLMSLENTIAYLEEQGAYIDEDTIKARDFIRGERNEND